MLCVAGYRAVYSQEKFKSAFMCQSFHAGSCASRRGWAVRLQPRAKQARCGSTRRGCAERGEATESISGRGRDATAQAIGLASTLFLSSVGSAHGLEEATSKYVPSPMDGPTWQVWVGAIVGVIPFVIATYEFSKRVIIQRRCQVCNGTGLVLRGTSKFYKKCRACGGFLPWLGWKAFLTGSLTGIANGSPVLPPEGQTSVFYKIPDGTPGAKDPETPGDK